MQKYHIILYYEVEYGDYVTMDFYIYGLSEEDAKKQAMKQYEKIMLPKVCTIKIVELPQDCS